MVADDDDYEKYAANAWKIILLLLLVCLDVVDGDDDVGGCVGDDGDDGDADDDDDEGDVCGSERRNLPIQSLFCFEDEERGVEVEED